MKTSVNHIESSHRIFKQYKQLADTSIQRLNDELFFHLITPESNSMAIIMKHMAGNMQSRWSDFLNADGEKASRKRDEEFDAVNDDRTSLTAQWELGWNMLFNTLESLTPDDLNKIVTIRSEPHSVMEALNRQIAHYSYHVGQMVFLARALYGENWESLSIPKGKSKDFNTSMNHQ